MIRVPRCASVCLCFNTCPDFLGGEIPLGSTAGILIHAVSKCDLRCTRVAFQAEGWLNFWSNNFKPRDKKKKSKTVNKTHPVPTHTRILHRLFRVQPAFFRCTEGSGRTVSAAPRLRPCPNVQGRCWRSSLPSFRPKPPS